MYIVHVYTYMYTYIHVYTYTCIHMCLYASVYNLRCSTLVCVGDLNSSQLSCLSSSVGRALSPAGMVNLIVSTSTSAHFFSKMNLKASVVPLSPSSPDSPAGLLWRGVCVGG